ncbi:MAG: hypothetical protein RL516_1248 [Bacteroidota bacterium]
MFSKNLIRFYLVFFVLISTFSIVSAQDNPEVKWKDGKKYFVHKIQKGETWSGLAVKYKSPMKELQSINPKAKELKFDQAVLIPFDNYLKSKKVSNDSKVEIVELEKNSAQPAKKNVEDDNQIQQKKSDVSSDKSTTTKKNDLKSNSNVIIYKVQPGETLYRIAKNHNMNFNDLAKFNGLKSTNVQAGQTIKIPINKTLVSNDVKEQDKADSVNMDANAKANSNSNTNDKANISVNSNLNNSTAKNEIEHHNDYSYHESNGSITEQGVATWIMESSISKNEKFYALHRSAPMGTIIKVNNPMSNRSVFVKVVGVLPDTGDNHDVLIKITQSAARRIGIFESRFRVEISYKSK